jgi:hypothetical protein
VAGLENSAYREVGRFAMRSPASNPSTMLRVGNGGQPYYPHPSLLLQGGKEFNGTLATLRRAQGLLLRAHASTLQNLTRGRIAIRPYRAHPSTGSG